MTVVYTTGVFDILHKGHINILVNAKNMGTHLVVGVQDDEGVFQSKRRYPTLSTQERVAQLESLPFVDKVIVYHNVDQRPYLEEIKPNIMIQGDDWPRTGNRTEVVKYLNEHHIQLVLLPYTQDISSSEIKRRVSGPSQKPTNGMNEVAKTFWDQSLEYPEYGTIKERRLHELNYLVPQLSGETLLDLGCGDGALLNCLIHLTHFKKFYGFDVSKNLLKHVNPIVETKVYDCYKPEDLPHTDVTIMAGVLPFLFEDQVVDTILSMIKSPIVFIRMPCTLEEESEYVNKFSEELKRDYASLYRTLPHVMGLISRHFRIEAVDRVYPDVIESKFGTKQFYIKATKQLSLRG